MVGKSWEMVAAANTLAPEADLAIGGGCTPTCRRRKQGQLPQDGDLRVWLPREVAVVPSALTPEADSTIYRRWPHTPCMREWGGWHGHLHLGSQSERERERRWGRWSRHLHLVTQQEQRRERGVALGVQRSRSAAEYLEWLSRGSPMHGPVLWVMCQPKPAQHQAVSCLVVWAKKSCFWSGLSCLVTCPDQTNLQF
jgi:hypothetical protein